jgi:hypothetical protein
VGVVTGFAGQAVGVRGWIYLREGFWLGGAGGMAAGAEYGGIEFRRDDAGGIGGMFGEWPVAGFAIDASMFAFALGVLNIGVAIDAGLVACEGDGMGGYFADGRGAVVAILAEGLRNDEAPHDEENEEGDYEESGKAEEMSCIFEEIHEAVSP